MLVITRNTGEWIDIGPDIRVRVLQFGKGRVRLGIEAPRDLQVRRSDPGERDDLTEAPDGE